jgi:hypothetical protein
MDCSVLLYFETTECLRTLLRDYFRDFKRLVFIRAGTIQIADMQKEQPTKTADELLSELIERGVAALTLSIMNSESTSCFVKAYGTPLEDMATLRDEYHEVRLVDGNLDVQCWVVFDDYGPGWDATYLFATSDVEREGELSGIPRNADEAADRLRELLEG